MRLTLLIAAVLLIGNVSIQAQSGIAGSEAEGRWNITVDSPDGQYPAWLEIKTSGIGALVGRFSGLEGSARPISEINYSEKDGSYSFSIPPQWSREDQDVTVEFTLDDKNSLSGSISNVQHDNLSWVAKRAPELIPTEEPRWGEPINMIKEELTEWKLPKNNQFYYEDGNLINKESGGNLISKEKFDDFKIHVEFRVPEGSNSGIYLRGRYEVQIMDSYGQKPDSHLLGGVYGFLEPTVNAAKRAGEWQTYDITLNGRMVTVELNGTEVICNRPIPGTTGGALDSNEGEPGPIMIQGDHGAVEFRSIIITPAVK